MSPKLRYLVAEINATMEVYLSGRIGQQYNRTAFILCDDCTELTSKLYLLDLNPAWSDQYPAGGFKGYRTVVQEVATHFQNHRVADHPAVDAIRLRFEGRRTRRNTVFHSTTLLDLNFHARDCVEALIDLLDYGSLLFGADWDAAVAGVANMGTCEAVLRIDHKAYSDPGVVPKMNAILKKQPRLGVNPSKNGCEVAHHPEDFHLRLAIRNGNQELRDKLRVLL